MGPLLADLREEGNDMTAIDESSTRTAPVAPGAIEANGINVIDESERKGTPRGLFWPWCASNISVLAVSLRRVRARLRDRPLAGPDRRRGRHDRVVPPGRPGVARGQARLGADPGRCRARRSACTATRCPAWSPTSCSSAGRPCSSRCRPSPTATVFERARLEPRRRRQGRRVRRRRAVIVVAGIMGFDADHAAADVADHRADRRDRRLRRCSPSTRSTGRRRRDLPTGGRAGGDRRADPGR